MASTFSPNLRLELIGTGDQQGTWGATTNTNLGTLLEEAIGGYVSVTVSNSGDTTLTANNGSADQSRNMVLNLVGTISATRNVICPAVEKLYVVKNATTGGFAVTFKVSGQTGVSIPNGTTAFIYVDGTDARAINGTIAAQNANAVSITGGSISGITDLAIADGGTGASNAADARTNLGLGTVATQNANAVSITGGSIAGSFIANASSLSVRDADGSNILSLAVGSNLAANTVLTLTTGATSNRTLDISASNVTISTAGAALIDDADASAQRTTLGLGTISTQDSNNVTITGGSISGITDLAVADGGTGVSTLTANAILLGNGASSITTVASLGTSGQVLTSNGAGSAPTFQTFSTIPSGTKMLFQQTSAPTGWTKDLTHDNKALRVVTGAAGSGGSVAFTTAFASQTVSGTTSSVAAGGTVAGHALTIDQIPSHTHTFQFWGGSGGGGTSGGGTSNGGTTAATGGSQTHNHGFTGTAHSHTFSSTVNLAVQYVDLIIATKD